MRIVIFGLSITSSWGNGHATLWRGLVTELAKLGHRVVFFERDTAYYARERDYTEIRGGQIVLYSAWHEVVVRATREVRSADAAIVTSFCPDGLAATALVDAEAQGVRCFYDLDTPVTLARLAAGESLSWVGPHGYSNFDLVWSYTGGRSLALLADRLGARTVWPLYGSVDPAQHAPVPPSERYACDLSYLGTYAPDRQEAVERLLIESARRAPASKFIIGGAQYPSHFPWTPNIYFVSHLPQREHAAFYCSSRLTLNLTREAMKANGYCPSARLFEAAACATPLISDDWEGVECFFEPGREILLARSTDDVLAALRLPASTLRTIGQAARERTLREHTAAIRAGQMVQQIDEARRSRSPLRVA